MKDASDSIDHFKQLSGREKTSKEVDSELTLAAASARRLSLHVNAWPTPKLSQELERIWLQAVQAGAKVDPQYRHVVREWEMACESLANLVSRTQQASTVGEADQDAVGTRIRDCQFRAKIGPKAEKAGWWQQRQTRFLLEELRHIERKVAPQATPSTVAARLVDITPEMNRRCKQERKFAHHDVQIYVLREKPLSMCTDGGVLQPQSKEMR